MTVQAMAAPVRIPGMPRLRWLWAAAGVLALLAAALLGVLVGPAHISPAAVLQALTGSSIDPGQATILWQLRLPRVVLGALVGGMLAAAGAAYQGVFRNPLADPYLLGAAAGAGLGATIVVAYGPSGSISRDLLPLAAFAGAALAVVVAYVLGRTAAPAGRAAALVLAGVTVASFLTALQTFVQQQNVDTVQEVYTWLLGRLA